MTCHNKGSFFVPKHDTAVNCSFVCDLETDEGVHLSNGLLNVSLHNGSVNPPDVALSNGCLQSRVQIH